MADLSNLSPDSPADIIDYRAAFVKIADLFLDGQYQKAKEQVELSVGITQKKEPTAMLYFSASLCHKMISIRARKEDKKERHYNLSICYEDLTFFALKALEKNVEKIEECDSYRLAIVNCLIAFRAKNIFLAHKALEAASESALGIRQKAYVHMLCTFVYRLENLNEDDMIKSAAARNHFKEAVRLLTSPE